MTWDKINRHPQASFDPQIKNKTNNNRKHFFLFVFERLDWFGIIDIILVTAIFFVLLLVLRDTQAVFLLRGGLLLIALLGIFASLEFSFISKY